MDKIITQKDEICGHCGCELPKGTFCYSDNFDEIRCEDCYISDYYGENYV